MQKIKQPAQTLAFSRTGDHAGHLLLLCAVAVRLNDQSTRHAEINEERMRAWPDDTLFVVYCAGPHCNGADRAALKLATLGRPVKIMIGGITGWQDEGYAFNEGT